MEKIIRTIHPVIKAVDVAKGIFDVIASDESLDRDREIVLASGWRFTNFQKNSPLVDSHGVGSISNLVGRVLDFGVTGGKLIERIQWAVDVDENELAKLGCQMMAAGYLKAFSVGFLPVSYLTPNSGREWTDALAALKLPADAPCRMIYTEQEQVELSVCVVGANPNALVKALADGVITQKHLDRFPEINQSIRRRVNAVGFKFPTESKTDSKEQFMNRLQILTNHSGVASPKKAFDSLEMLRRDGTDVEIEHAVLKARIALAAERANGGLDPIEQHLKQPGRREFWMALARFLQTGGVGKDCLTAEQKSALSEMQVVNKDLDASLGGTGTSFFLGQEMSQDIFDLLLTYGAFRTLGLRIMEKQFTKYAKITGRPSAVFIPPSTQLTVPIPADVTASGTQLLPEATYVAALLNISIQLLEDNKVDFARLMIETFTQSLGARIDYACFMGNGVADANNGGQTGIFVDANIKNAVAAMGHVAVEQLDRYDFLSVISLVASAALQRPCSWWINPAFIPILLKIADGNGTRYLLRTPADTGDGTWSLVGFPVVWSAQAPAIDAANQRFAAFGNGDSYLVAMREEFELQTSRHPNWNTLQEQYRAASRVFCQTRESTGFATLTTAAH